MYKFANWFRNLKVSEKLGLISIFFIMPDSVMLYLFITGINANLQFASLEKMGNTYQRPLEVLLELIPEHEFLAERALADGTGASVELTQKEVEIDTAFARSSRPSMPASARTCNSPMKDSPSGTASTFAPISCGRIGST